MDLNGYLKLYRKKKVELELESEDNFEFGDVPSWGKLVLCDHYG